MREPELLNWPKRYGIRKLGQLTLPSEILQMLDWREGDSVNFSLDRSNGALVLTKHVASKSKSKSSVIGR